MITCIYICLRSRRHMQMLCNADEEKLPGIHPQSPCGHPIFGPDALLRMRGRTLATRLPLIWSEKYHRCAWNRYKGFQCCFPFGGLHTYFCLHWAGPGPGTRIHALQVGVCSFTAVAHDLWRSMNTDDCSCAGPRVEVAHVRSHHKCYSHALQQKL